MKIKHMATSEVREPIRLGPYDGAFVFRANAGMEMYTPTYLDPVAKASDESIVAMMLGWAVTDKDMRNELERRFQAYLAKQPANR